MNTSKHGSRNFPILCLILLAALILPAVIHAQEGDDENTCPALVEQAVALASDVCQRMGRNEACYGHTLVSAAGWEDITLDFAQPGDRANVLELAHIATAPLNAEDDSWGVAVLALQANLPGTLPGQNVTFVLFGDVEVENEVVPDAYNENLFRLTGQAASNANLRGGPGTNFNVVGSLQTGEALTFTGRNDAGDWLRLVRAGVTGWVFRDLVTLEDGAQIDALAVMGDAGQPGSYGAPMQAFRFSTGIGQRACEEAPLSGLMIQAPRDTTVNFRVNGIEMTIGSTALLRLAEDDSILLANLDGTITVTIGNTAYDVPFDREIRIPPGQVPDPPRRLIYDELRGVPFRLLPEEIGNIGFAGTFVNYADCVLIALNPDGTTETIASAPAGQPILVGSRIYGYGAARFTQAVITDSQNASVQALLNGQPMTLVRRQSPYPITVEGQPGLQITWLNVLMNPAPGTYRLTVDYLNSQLLALANSQTSYACTFEVAGP